MQHFILTEQNQAEAVALAVQTLLKGGLVVYPTETLYGVGVDGTNTEAVTRLLAYKNRPAGKAISVAVANRKQAQELVTLNSTAHALYETFLPGPLTVISLSRGVVDSRLQSELGTLGVRISSHPFVQELTAHFPHPITATSANASGKTRPYSIKSLLENLSEKQKKAVDLIIDAGELPPAEPSTVIDTTQEVQEIIRAGAQASQFMRQLISSSEAETLKHAAKLMKGLEHALPAKAVVFALEGEMGAGKTHFAKGIARQLEIKVPITSPTYTLMKEYPIKEGKLVHVDCWRLAEVDPAQLELEQYFIPGSVVVIEWAAPLLPYLQSLASNIVGYHILIEQPNVSTRHLKLNSL